MGEGKGEKFTPESENYLINLDLVPSSGSGTSRCWVGTVQTWDAPSFFHRPLYFEQKNLERYGHYHKDWQCQCVLSAADFFCDAIFFPIKKCHQDCCERVYTLGHFRPGNCNPNYLYNGCDR